MTPYERLYNRMAGLPVDRVPNLNIFMALAAKQTGVSYREFVSDYRKLVAGVLWCQEAFDIDCYCVVSDPMREAEGFGAQVTLPEEGVPFSPVPFVDVEDIAKLKVVPATSCARMEDRLLAVRDLAERAKGDIPVIGWVEGAFAESCDLMSVAEVMYNLIDEPEAMHELLEICTQQAISFAKEQIACGADMIGIGDAASSLIGADMYGEFVMPYQKRIIDAVHEAGAKAKLHICGNMTQSLCHIAKVGADIVDCDHPVSMQKAAEILPESCAINGNTDPVAILDGTRESIYAEVEKLAGICPKLIISAGCEIPRDTDPQHVKWMVEAINALKP